MPQLVKNKYFLCSNLKDFSEINLSLYLYTWERFCVGLREIRDYKKVSNYFPF